MRIFTLDPAGYVGRAMTQRLAEHGHQIVGPAKDATSPADLLSAAVSADAVLLDLTAVDREADLTALLAMIKDYNFEAAAAASSAAAPRSSPLLVIGLSTVLTWNATQKSSKKSSKESNWRLRKSSPRYRVVRGLESILLSVARENAIVSLVVASGVLYGNGEHDFHHLFKDSWMHAGEPVGSSAYEGLPLIGDGKNLIPTIHVFDLVSVLRMLLESPPAEQSYFIAVDQGHTSQKALVTAISTGLGDGRIKPVDKMDERVLLAASTLAAGDRAEEPANAAAAAASSAPASAPAPVVAATPAAAAAAAASAAALSSAVSLANSLTNGNPEVMCADMKLDAEWLLSQPFEWHCEQGPAASPEAFDAIRLEFVKARNLKPVRIMVTGGPGAGKSFYSAKLASQYYIPHLSLSSMLSDALSAKDEFAERLQASLLDSANALKLNKNKKQKAKEKAAALAAAGGAGAPAKGSKRNASVSSAPAGPVDLSLFDSDVPRLPAYLLSKLVKSRVRTPLCRNKGFVLDGFPRTVEESRWFFSPDVEEDPETGEPLSKIEDKRALAREAAALAEEEGDEAPVDPPEPQPRDPTTMVDSIVFLGCSEQLAAARCKALAADAIIPGHNDEEGFHRRWARWATIMELNPATATGAALASANAGAPVAGGDAALSPLAFVQDSVEVLELSESVAADSAKALQLISIYCNTKTGRAANYHPTSEEEAQAKHAADSKQQQAADAQAKEQAARSKAESAQRARYDSNAALRRAAVLLEDSMLIEASSLPIRNYLMSNVIPALVDGLLDVCKVQPEDPVDYLAEYLFKYSVDVPFDAENAQDRPAV